MDSNELLDVLEPVYEMVDSLWVLPIFPAILWNPISNRKSREFA
jgi:hypothetical protein